jgi:hypothetical protein
MKMELLCLIVAVKDIESAFCRITLIHAEHDAESYSKVETTTIFFTGRIRFEL